MQIFPSYPQGCLGIQAQLEESSTLQEVIHPDSSAGGVIHPAGCSALWNLWNFSPRGAHALEPGSPACPASPLETLLIAWGGLEERVGRI